MSFTPLVFLPDDREGNLNRMLEFEHLGSLSECPVRRFHIYSPHEFKESSTTKPDWDPEFALLLLCLYRIYGGDRNHFKITGFMRKIVIAYYGGKICQEAIDNPSTQHLLIRIILTPDASVTTIKIK